MVLCLAPISTIDRPTGHLFQRQAVQLAQAVLHGNARVRPVKGEENRLDASGSLKRGTGSVLTVVQM